jgi:single-strand DNA-binding protein
MNLTVLRGRLARPAEQRSLPSGDDLVSLEVSVPRDQGPAESVGVVWFAAPASAAAMDTDDEVFVIGRVRRRFFRAGGSTQSRTEVVADAVVGATQTRRVRALLLGAASRLESEAASGSAGTAAPAVKGRRQRA